MIDGVDTAYPHDSYPAWAKVVCGYAGGHTPHQWTAAEVQAVRRSGRHWWAIWTSLNASGTLTTALGNQDALGMIARLPSYFYPKTDPVFYDVEPSIFDRDPAGARAAISAWKANMHAAGYTKAYVYTVERQGGDWIANPDNGKPTSIPAGKIGVQYVLDRGGYDYNVFADSLIGEVRDDMSAADVAAINKHADDIRKANQDDLRRLAQWLSGAGNAVFNPTTLVGITSPGVRLIGLIAQEAAQTALIKALAANSTATAEQLTEIVNAAVKAAIDSIDVTVNTSSDPV